jgi:CRP/FNR family cyclic AMP-dependent transcriptional regulator
MAPSVLYLVVVCAGILAVRSARGEHRAAAALEVTESTGKTGASPGTTVRSVSYRPHMSMRMRKEDKIEVLASLPLFESCTKRELGDIASIMIEVERPAGTYLTREGQDGGLMFVVVDGRAEVLAHDGDRNHKVIGRLGSGDVVGELSLIDGRARSASVRSVTDVRLLEIVQDDFNRLVHRSPKFVRNLLRSLSLRVRQAEALTS